LLEAALSAGHLPELGIDGFGPDKTMYLSVLKALGLHRCNDGEKWEFTEPDPDSSVGPAWEALVGMLMDATASRLRVDEVYERLAAPPFGVRAGLAPVLMTVALLVYANDLALYEHGTFRPTIEGQVVERLLRNPANFELKCFAARTGKRARFLDEVAQSLSIVGRRGAHSTVSVVSHLVMALNRLPHYSRTTATVSLEAQRVRREIGVATEPDDLIFRAIPEAVGCRAVGARSHLSDTDLIRTAQRIQVAIAELEGAFPQLLGEIERTLYTELRVQRPAPEAREALRERSREIESKVIDPHVARLIVALCAEIPDHKGWLQYAAQNVAGRPPEAWTDDDRHQFVTVAKDVSAAFCRVEALNADLRLRGSGFDAVRVTLTRPDGSESIKLVWVDDARRKSIADLVEDAVARVAQRTSSGVLTTKATEHARELLLAALAELELEAETDAETATFRIGERSHTDIDRPDSQRGYTA
jgi:hypothetical protein